MPRRPRWEYPGAIHHVHARRPDRLALFGDDAERERYLDLLARTVFHRGWHCLAYCLMDTHVHLLVETPRADLGRGIQFLHGTYAREFNDRRERAGHVFDRRFGSDAVVRDDQLWAVVAYLALNPVRAGMCARPEDHPWSSHAALAGLVVVPDWLAADRLLGHFGAHGGEGGRRYAQHVEEALLQRSR